MSIGPILPGRLPSTLMSERLQQNLQRGNLLLAKLQDQLATGQKFFLPSDAPSAAVRTIFLQKVIERKSQMQVNIKTDRSILSSTEASLASISDALVQGKSLLLAGVGNTVSDGEREAFADEVKSILEGAINTANTQFRGRYVFGGSESQRLPFERVAGGAVRYNGDALNIDSFIDFGRQLSSNVDGASAFSALATVDGGDANPALTLGTKIANLRSGLGVSLGKIVVTVNDGVNPAVTATVDLAGAETIGDIQNRIQNAVGTGPPSLTVDVNPATKSGLRLTPSGGTVTVSDITGSQVAASLGIASAAAAQIPGTDLNPKVTLQTKLADLNGGAGVGSTGNGLLITNGPKSGTVNISSAVTVEDLFNQVRAANLDLDPAINAAGNGITISSRLSAANFSIGEDGGTQAADLGVRTFRGTTLLADLNLGRGVPVRNLDGDGNLMPAPSQITRRNGTTASVDLKGLFTVQQVLNAINAVDPGVLVASLNTVGNGISLVDNDGVSTGPLSVATNTVSTALGIAGSETGTNAAVPLVGSDVNPTQAKGVFSILSQLETALRNGDDVELSRLDSLINGEISRVNLVRGEIGTRLQTLEDVENRLLDEEVSLQESLSKEFDSDVTEVITQVSQVTSALQATMQVAALSFQLSLLNYL